MEIITHKFFPRCVAKWNIVEEASGGISTLRNMYYMDMADHVTDFSMITLKFNIKSIGETIYVMNSYGPQPPYLKRIFMAEINSLGSHLHHKIWLIRGDFNMIMN